MSTPDERQYLRKFTRNPFPQESFILDLLSMERYFALHKGDDSVVVSALETVIGAFTEQFTDWEREESLAFGGVQYVREQLAQNQHD
jgi:hypothetical protein